MRVSEKTFVRRSSMVLSMAALANVLVTTACRKGDQGGTDSASGAASAPAAAVAGSSAASASRDTSHAGMSGMSGMTGDPDHDFLRMMSDHHKGMIAMAHDAVERKPGLSVTPDAQKLDKEQDQELEKMISTLETDYKDSYTPKIMPDNQAMVDDLKSKSGKAYDRAFYEHVVMHHEQAVKMIDDYLPKAKKPAVKEMAEKMRATQTKEIAEFRQKASRAGA